MLSNRRDLGFSSSTQENTLSQLVGSKIFIRTPDGEYEGIVKRVWGDSEKISLDKVTALPSRKLFVGLQYFFRQDILHISVIEKSSGMKRDQHKNVKQDVSLPPLPIGEIDNKETSDYSDEDDEFTADRQPVVQVRVEDYCKKGNITWGDDLDDEINQPMCGSKTLALATKYILLDEINSEFDDSITNVMEQSAVGVSLESRKGRFGEITLISVATRSFVYLFDIMALGIAAFDRGLKIFLETPSIIKIFHDCRLPSDALFHIYNVTLNNIIDTQVNDVVCQLKVQGRSLPQYASSLVHCLKSYLSLDDKYMPIQQSNSKSIQKDALQWNIRPLLPLCRDKSIRSVIFLQELRSAQMNQLFADLRKGVDIYLGVVRDASDEELALNLGSPHVLPPAMSSLGFQGRQFIHEHKFLKQENEDNVWDPSVLPLQQQIQRVNLNKELDMPPRIPTNTSSAESIEDPRKAKLTNSKSVEELVKVRWASNYSALPKDKCVPSGTMGHG